MLGLAIILVLIVIVAPIASLAWAWRLSGSIADLTAKVRLLEQRQSGAQAAPASRENMPEPAEGSPEPVPTGTPERPPVTVAGPVKDTDEVTTGESDRPETFEPAPPPAPEQEAPRPDPVDRIPARKKLAWEERLASSWMVWLGGVTVALAAVFLFRYAIDQGYLTPLTRVVLGLIGGGLLLSAGEWTQRRPIDTGRVVNADYVPPALSAAGIFAVLVSLFSAHALYGLIGPGPAFVTMGMTAYASLALALRQGWFVALLGILAGYLIPALITSPEPNALALFVYLFVLTLGALALMVWRHWVWFSVLTITGALTWPVLWTFGAWSLADQGILGLYSLGLAAAFAVLSTRLPVVPEDTATLRWIAQVVSHSSGLGFTLSGILLIHLGFMADFNAAAFAFLAIYVALALGLGVWRASLESLPVIAAFVVLAAVLIWPQPYAVSQPERIQELGVASASNAFGPYVMPPEFFAFSRALWTFAALFGLGGFLALGRVLAKPAWAGLSAFMPVVLFVVGYWRIGDFQIDIAWSYWAAGLGILLFLATLSISRRLPGDQRDVPVALYAAGVTAAIALIFTCLLREAWLTVALSLEVAALAWIWSALRVRELKTIAIAVLAVVVLRLVGNPQVLDYQGSILGNFGWVIYGYGIPAAATFLAARTFARESRDLTVTLCEIAAIGFAFLTVTLQLKLWTSGAIYTDRWDFLDGAVQANWWIIAGGLLLNRPYSEQRYWAPPAGLAVLGASAFLIVAGSLLSNNPLLTRYAVGSWPLFNLLSVAYLLPAILFLGLAGSRRFDIPDVARKPMAAGSGVLIFVDLTLEVRRAFWADIMALTPTTFPTSAEIYAYSAVWTIFALVLLALGILWKSQSLRYASLAVLLVTVVKLFLYDMSDLTGLYRVASFLGLGLTLIGIGRVYQRFVFTKEPGPETPLEDA